MEVNLQIINHERQLAVIRMRKIGTGTSQDFQEVHITIIEVQCKDHKCMAKEPHYQTITKILPSQM